MTGLGVSGRIARFFLSSQLTPLIAIVLVMAGVFAVIVTPREEEPQIDVTMANVFIPFPGASAKDVETLVAIPAEQVLSQIPGLEHVWSVSRPGQALITVQYKVGVPRTEAIVRLHDTILSHRDWLPPELNVGEPLVRPKGIDDVPIVALTLWTKDPARGAYDLEQVAHAVEVELKRVPGTREVTTIGGPGRVVQVLLDPAKLNAHGLAAADLKRALQAANTALPAGTIVRGNETIFVETGEFLQTAKAVRELVVGVHDGQPVYLGDVARVVDGPPPPAHYAWHALGKAGGGQGVDAAEVGRAWPAVTIQVTKKTGENAVVVAQRVEQRLAQLRNTVIPAGVETSVTRDYGRTADDKAKLLISKLLFATASVVALVLVTLGRREAVIVGVAVLLTLAATLFASWAWGFTLNRVSLFALIFSIGILVDDAIVVVENIHRHRALEPDAPLADADPARGRRSGRPDDPRHVHGDRRAAADGVRHRADGAVHEPDPDQREHGHGDLARGRVRDHAVAGAQADAAARARGPGGEPARPLARVDVRAAAHALRRRPARRAAAEVARRRDRRRDPRVGVARARAARGAEDAAVRQQERVPGDRRHAGGRAGRGHGGGALGPRRAPRDRSTR